MLDRNHTGRHNAYIVELCRDYGVDLDVPFISHFRVFHDPFTLVLGDTRFRGTRCTFHLTDEDIN